ncbi:hypothetical protein LTR56_027891, partial [Elasticomyces elasticus]
DFAAVAAKDSSNQGVPQWPDEILHQAQQYFGSRPQLLGTFEPSRIDVLIVGTGFAGLTAALECTRKGHNVRILERNSDMYFVGLSATRFLKHWPEMPKQYDHSSLHNAWIETFKHDGEQIRNKSLDGTNLPNHARQLVRQVRRFAARFETVPQELRLSVEETYTEDLDLAQNVVYTPDSDRAKLGYDLAIREVACICRQARGASREIKTKLRGTPTYTALSYRSSAHSRVIDLK